jgi:hypothetical protein
MCAAAGGIGMTSMLLYLVHERAWAHHNYGVCSKPSGPVNLARGPIDRRRQQVAKRKTHPASYHLHAPQVAACAARPAPTLFPPSYRACCSGASPSWLCAHARASLFYQVLSRTWSPSFSRTLQPAVESSIYRRAHTRGRQGTAAESLANAQNVDAPIGPADHPPGVPARCPRQRRLRHPAV